MNRFRNNFFKKFNRQEETVIENALWLAYKRYKDEDNLTEQEMKYKNTAHALLQEIIGPLMRSKT